MTKKAVSGHNRANAGTAILRWMGRNSVFLVLVALVVVGSMVSRHFLRPGNIESVARNLPIIGLMAIGLTFVILTAGIDLSVGAVLSLIVVVSSYHLANGGTIVSTILMCLAIGACVGILNAVLITKGRLEPFIVTLATLSIVGGAALIFTDGQTLSIGSSDQAMAYAEISPSNLLGVPTPMVIFLVLFVVCVFLAHHTQFGRNVYAVGSNQEAARLAGVNVTQTKIGVYVISGLLAAVSGIVWSSRLTAGDPIGGEGYELDAIACAVIGGASLFGGEGSLGGTLIGILIVTVLNNLMNLLGIPPYSQKIAKGAIIALAVLVERQRQLHRQTTVVAKFAVEG